MELGNILTFENNCLDVTVEISCEFDDADDIRQAEIARYPDTRTNRSRGFRCKHLGFEVTRRIVTGK